MSFVEELLETLTGDGMSVPDAERLVSDALNEHARELAGKIRAEGDRRDVINNELEALAFQAAADLIDPAVSTPPAAKPTKPTKLEMFMAAEGSTPDELCACGHTRKEHSVNGRHCRHCLCGGGYAGVKVGQSDADG